MASASTLRPIAQHESPHPLSGSRGRSNSREHRSPSRSTVLAQADMGADISKLVKSAEKPLPQEPPVVPVRTRSGTIPLSTAYSERGRHSAKQDDAICSSPTWSPKGSLSARNQADKDRRERERALKKEAEEAKKRLKEFKESGRRSTAPAETTVSILNADGTHTSKLQKKSGRRFIKQPPPAAMETQKLPAALRTDMERSQSEQSLPEQHQGEQGKRSRSSSLSSIIRLVTGRSRSTSATRKGSMSEDEHYMSDVSTKSRSSFIGGVKLRRQEQNKSQAPTAGTNVAEPIRHSQSFSLDMHEQIDQITGRSVQDVSKSAVAGAGTLSKMGFASTNHAKAQNGEKELPEEPAEVNANMGKRRSQRSEAEQKPVDQVHSSAGEQSRTKQTIAENLRSSREASLNRMQNLVTPLRSAMKGGRQVAKGGRTQSMPLIPSKGKSAIPAHESKTLTSSSTYVNRSRLSSQKRSLTGWHDEMAVVQANELAAAQAATEAKSNVMKPAPESKMSSVAEARVTISAMDQAAKVVSVKQGTITTLTPQTGSASGSNITPDSAKAIVWKQPIKANKDAAAERAEKASKSRVTTDINKLPSQANRSLVPTPLFVTRSSGPMLKDVSSNAVKLPPPTSPISSDDENSGLRRHPAVMSWKAEKESPKMKYASLPRAATLPMVHSDPEDAADQPQKQTLRPEDHPSLAALRGAAASPRTESTLPDYSDPIARPFSIIPTPVPSPAPTAKPSQSSRPLKPAVVMQAQTKAAAVKIIEALKQRQAEEAEAEEEDEFEDASSIQQTPRSSPTPMRRHSTPPVEMSTKPAETDKTAPVFPFPDRHEPLVKPAGRPTMPDKRATSGGKVTFHTPPESPRFLSVSTSYESYRRHGASETSPQASTPDLEEDVQLPVPVSQLGKPNPPFARDGRKTPSPNRTNQANGTPATIATCSNRAPSAERSKGYVYVNFSPAGSSSTVDLSEAKNGAHSRRIPKGFMIKNADGLPMDPIAKLFVICCGCKKWHDVPSNIYREMAKGLREIDPQQDGIAEARIVSHGDGGSGGEANKVDKGSNVKKRRSGVISTVPCCWCKHEMSVICCEGWSTLCYMSAQYHARQEGAKLGNGIDMEKVQEKGPDTRDKRASRTA